MDSSRAGNGTSAHAVAAVASMFVIVTGAGAGAYLMRFRGTPAGVPLSNAELAILGGGLVAVAAATHFAVAAAFQHAAARLRRLLAHALELDATDPQAAAAFEAEPQLRDLVNMWIGEKTQARELGDRMETMRGEIDGLIAGMARSAQDLGRLRTDSLSPVGVQIASLWNVLLERTRPVEPPVQAAPSAPAPTAAVNAVPEVRALVARLDELESELERLRTHVQEPLPAVLRESAGALSSGHPPEKVPLLLPETDDDIQEGVLFTPSVLAEPEWGDVHIVEPTGHAQPWQLDDEAMPAPSAAPALAPNAVASPSVEASPAPAAIRPGEVVAVVPGMGRPQPARVPASALAEPGAMQFEDLDFPHFVGRPVGDVADRVAVTYDAATASEPGDLPASSLLFDDEPAAPSAGFEFGHSQPPERSR